MINESKNEVSKNSQPVSIGHFLKAKEKQIAMALPKHMTSDKLLRIAMTEITRNPSLKECTMESLVGALIQSAQLGLFPDSLLGEAWLIPYKNNNKGGALECQFQVGYKGLMKLAYNSAMIEDIDAHEVCANDVFEFEYGTNAHLKHIPNLENRGDVICYYAAYKLKNSSTFKFLVMPKEDIEKRRTYSKANSRYSPWNTSYDEMAKKTTIRSILKYAPKSSEDLNLAKAISLDEQAEAGLQNTSLVFKEDVKVITDEKPNQSKSEKLVGALSPSLQVQDNLLKTLTSNVNSCASKEEWEELGLDMTAYRDSNKLSPAEYKCISEIYEKKGKEF